MFIIIILQGKIERRNQIMKGRNGQEKFLIAGIQGGLYNKLLEQETLRGEILTELLKYSFLNNKALKIRHL